MALRSGGAKATKGRSGGPLKTLSRPCDLDHRAVLGEDPVGKRDLGAGALQQ
ncbi:hypothetical protein E4T56_gene17739, partial [Termitomyces sp. T112]